jgi:hypothetical protein
MNKNADTGLSGTGVRGTSPVSERSVPEWDAECRDANAGGIGLYTESQLYGK